MQHPPCTPRPSLRRRRARVSALVALFIVAAILAFLRFEPSAFQGDQAQASSLMPGQLSGAHSNFALDTKGCAACHEAHGQGVVAWAKAFVTSQNVGDNCVDCHSFGGSETSPHNATFNTVAFKADSPSANMRTDCVMCHTEHKGADANIAPMKDQQCNSCHQTEVKSFSTNHPDFGDRYPHEARGAIQFDHVKHFGEHFPKENVERTCVDCHDVKQAGLTVPVTGFDANCASCHTDGITDRPMALVALPYMEEDPFDMDNVADTCGLTPEQAEYLRALADGDEPDEVELDEYFYEDNGDNLTRIMALVLGVANDDPDEYTEAAGGFLAGLAESGSEPLVDALSELPGEPNTAKLLAGLDGELLRQAACAWMQKVEYEAPNEVSGGGWESDGLFVNYRPSGHADPVARAWFDYAVNAPAMVAANDGDEDMIARAEALRSELLGDQGLGNCTKCHAVTQITDKSDDSADNNGGLMVEWGFQPVVDRPYVKYDHRPHINLLGPGSLCTECHTANPQAEYAASFAQFDASSFESGFKPVAQQKCTECHTKAKVRQDCQLCHEYHLEPGFNESMVGHTAQTPTGTGKDGGER